MTTESRFRNYIVPGFALVLSPGKVVDADIYIKEAGGIISVRGCDVFDKRTHRYLGWVEPTQLQIEVRRAMQDFCRKHTKQWLRCNSQGQQMGFNQP